MMLKIEVDERRMAYLLCAGMEGGINYWARVIDARRPDSFNFQMDPDNGLFRYVDYPMNKNGSITLEIIHDYGSANMVMPHDLILTKEKLIRGLETMAKIAPRHFADWIGQSEDATTGDVFVQCVVFGEIIFG